MERKQLKEWAKSAFHKNYWKAVLAAVILGLTVSSGFSGGSFNSSSNVAMDNFENMTQEEVIAAVVAVCAVFLIAGIFWLALRLVKIFVLNPLQVGGRSFFVKGLSDLNVSLSELGRGFKYNYKNVALIMFLKDLYLWLWSLLWFVPMFLGTVGTLYFGIMALNKGKEEFIAVLVFMIVITAVLTCAAYIPWIIKYYQYMMIPYILTQNPSIGVKQAFFLTKQMMNGYKFKAWVLSLSFIGWYLLSFCTCGILTVLYVNPYYQYTQAAFFKETERAYIEKSSRF